MAAIGRPGGMEPGKNAKIEPVIRKLVDIGCLSKRKKKVKDQGGRKERKSGQQTQFPGSQMLFARENTNQLASANCRYYIPGIPRCQLFFWEGENFSPAEKSYSAKKGLLQKSEKGK